jgi:hypothetical protein
MAIFSVFVENQTVSLAFLKVLLGEKKLTDREWVKDNLKALVGINLYCNSIDSLYIYVILSECGVIESGMYFIFYISK